MEAKNLTANVTTNETVYNQSAEQAIDIEFTLPDYLPDISRILKCKAVSFISSKGINGSNVNVDGCVTVTVMYLDEDGEIYSYEYQYPYNKSFDVGDTNKNLIIRCNSICEYINCRAVTGRKIDIHGAALITVECIAKNTVEILCDIDDDDIEINRTDVPVTTPMGYGEKVLILEEELEIGKSQQPVSSLLRYEGKPIIKESRLINGKVIVKGEMCISALYAAEDGSLQCFKNTIPFSQIIEIEGVDDECECDNKITLGYLEMKPKAAGATESRCLILNAKLLLSSTAYCENNIEIITDAFSKKYDFSLKNGNMTVEKLVQNISESFNCKKNLELSSADISSLADIWSDIQSVNCKFEKDTLYITGTAAVGVMAYDAKQEVCYFEKNIDFEYKKQLDIDTSDLYCLPSIEVVSANYTLIPSGIEFRIELSVNAAVYKNSKISFVEDISVDKNSESKRKRNGALVIYFASSGENIWDIAKQYSSDVDEIKQLNGITDETLSLDKKIIVPIS